MIFGIVSRRFYSNAKSTIFTVLKYEVKNRVASITLNRPDVFNAITQETPTELRTAVELANSDDSVKVITVTGAGKAFCSGYDLKKYAECERGTQPGSQTMPWDPYVDYKFMSHCNECYMSLWRSLKPTVAAINGVCVGGGTDIALACDITFIAEEARIGYPPARLWGCPTGAMWAYRMGFEKAKRLLFTGALLTGREAVEQNLIGECVPLAKLQETVQNFLDQLITVPVNQLFFQKQVVNNIMEMVGVHSSQRLATLFDGMTRHTPEGVAFQQRCFEVGFKQAVQERDRGVEFDKK